jgi:hypothetical protein
LGPFLGTSQPAARELLFREHTYDQVVRHKYNPRLHKQHFLKDVESFPHAHAIIHQTWLFGMVELEARGCARRGNTLNPTPFSWDTGRHASNQDAF